MKTTALRTLAAALAAGAAFASLPARAADVPSYYPPRGGAWQPAGQYECFAVFALRRDGHGEQITRYGPEEVGQIGDLRYADGRRLNNRVRSIRTGQNAWLELYNGRDYRFPTRRIAPGTTTNLLLPSVDSYRLTCEAPVIRTNGW